jgi:hypothetical protein
MVWTLFQFKVPCAVLVKGGAHWIVVYSYEPIDLKPLDSADTSYNISGFFVRNPVHGSEQGHIDRITWLSDYAIPVNNGGYWDEKFLCICDPKKRKRNGENINIQSENSGKLNPSRKKLIVKVDLSSSQEKAPSDKAKFKSSQSEFPKSEITMIDDPVRQDKKIFDKNTARKYAHWVLQTRRIHKSKALKLNMQNPSSGDPVLVEYIGKNDFYYIVPMRDINGKIYATMIIAAMKTSYRESSFAMDIKRPLRFSALTNNEILSLLIKQKYLKSSEQEEVQFHKALVWKSCNESLSPHLPFQLVTIKKQQIFIRIDGEVFEKLTQGVQGF